MLKDKSIFPLRFGLRDLHSIARLLFGRTRCVGVAIALTLVLGSLASAENFRVFLLGGQSNMGGVAPVDDLPAPFDQPNEDVWIWQDDEDGNVGWTALRGGFSGSGSTGNDDTFGPEVSLGSTLAGSFGVDRVAFVKHGEAGVGATMQLGWNPDLGGVQGPGKIYSDLLDKTDKALSFLSNDGHSFEISGVFFAQGNRDTSPNEDEGNAAAEYEVNFTNFIDAIRNEFASPTLPVVFGQLGDFAINHENPIRRRNVRLVRDAQASVAANDSWASMVTTDDISKLDIAHFDAAGQIDFGQRLANSYLALTVPVLGDCTGDRILDSADLACITSIEERDVVLSELGTLPGDLDANGSVDFEDFLVLAKNFGMDLAAYTEGNIDLAGGVGFSDFLVLADNFGRTSEVASVPEPQGGFAWWVALIFLEVRRNRLRG